MRGLILAIQFLTRLPTPQLTHFDPAWLAESAKWFAVVGLMIGGILAVTTVAASYVDPVFAALVGVVVWVWVTGGLHLDGLADLADGLGAAHRDPQRFLAVLKDPHLGSFGVLALVLAVLSKWSLLWLWVQQIPSAPEEKLLFAGTLCLIPAWARLFTVYWSHSLPALSQDSSVDPFRWQLDRAAIYGSTALLWLASAWINPWLCLAPLLGWRWRQFLWRRLGGVSGDCLGAGIEIVEIGLLTLACVGPTVATRLIGWNVV